MAEKPRAFQRPTHWVRALTLSLPKATARRPRELGDFKGVGHFEAKF